MNVLVLLVFVTLMLVVGAVVAFAWSVKQDEHDHADRLSLLPLEDHVAARPASGATVRDEAGS